MKILFSVILTAFAVLGCVCCAIFTSVRFLGLIFLGIAALMAGYAFLIRAAKKRRKAAKVVLIVISCVIAAGLLAAAATGTIIFRSMAGEPEKDCAYVIVLGAGVNGTEPSLSLQERINAAYDYLSDHPASVCVVSGGQGPGESITEAACMRRELTERGIPAERIWMEEKATTTRENLRYSLDLIEARTGIRPTQIGLVSSDYHLYRASLFAREQNVSAVGIPAHTAWLTLRLNYFLREIVAVWYYTILGGL